jgi:Domain of unknown function (DUF4349)
LWLTFFVVACGQQSNQAEPQSMPAPVSVEMSRSKVANDNVVADSTGGAEQSLTEISEPTSSLKTKYIALRHYLQIETPAEKMQASFDAAVKHCEALNCQMLSANYNRATSYNPPSASMSVRVPPRNVQIFLTGLAKNGEVLQHGRDSEDKTNQVVDTDARIQNLTHLRDRLRGMLNDKTAKFKDIIDVERELANTQAQLDSMTSLRKVLSQETDLVAVNIDFVATQGIAEQGFFAPVARAFKDAGRVMMESFGALITFVVSLIPWLIIGIPLLWLMIRLWKKLTFKKT